MKSRADVVRFMNDQLHVCGADAPLGEKGRQWHYGRQELKQLLDYLYGGPPQHPDDELRNE